jgi:hypothetical protein
MKRIRWFIRLAAVALLGVFAVAQTPTGTVQGSVTDSTGAAIQGASITIVRTATNETRVVSSDSAGRFTIPFVQPGSYTVTVAASGFRSAKQENIVVEVAGTRPVDFKLDVGTVSQSVQVSATTENLDVSSSSLGQTIQSETLLELPDNGRNPFDFAQLVPGVNNTGNASTPHIGGSRNGNNEQQIDGMSNILPENNVGNNSSAYTPIMDSVQEVNVQTSVLPAEYGRFSGGTISLITKGGGNEFHGTLFEFAENQAFFAKPFGSGTAPKPDMYRYQSGGTIGGPIVHNKAFFFFDYEDSRQSNGQQATYSVPQPQWLTGDFTGITTPIYDPYTVAKTGTDSSGNPIYTRQQLKGDDGTPNKIPSKYLNTPASKLAQAALAFFPKPNIQGAGLLNNFRQVGTSLNNYWHYDTRADYEVTKSWHSFLRLSQFANDSSPLNDYNNAASPGNYNGPAHSTALSISFNNTVTFTPSLLGEFRYGYSKSTVLRTPFKSAGFSLTSLGFPQSYADQAEIAGGAVFPHFGFSQGYSNLGTDGYVALKENPLAQDVNGSLVKILGGHSFKVGGEFRRLLLDFYQYAWPTGNFNVDESWTRLNPQNNDGTGNPFASLMLGLPSSGDLPNEPSVVSTSGYWAAYAQDDWKMTRKLTLNLGVRWDVEVPRAEKNNQMSYWDPTAPSPLGSVSPAAGVSCPNCGSLKGQMVLVGTQASKFGRRQGPIQWNDWAPRVGVAYNPTPKLVVRSGFGIVFQPSAMQAAGTSGAPGIEGFTSQTNLSTTFTNEDTAPTFDLSNPLPSGYNLPQGKNAACRAAAACVQGIDIGTGISQSYFNSYRTPYSIQWNASAQYALPGSIKLELGYLGNRGVYLIDGDPGKTFDQLPTSYLSQGSALLASVSNPFYGVVTVPGSDIAQSTIQLSKLLRKWPQYDGVSSFRKPGSSSTFNAFTIRADKNLTHGLTFTLSFTDGREYDNAASAVNYLGTTSQTYGDQYNPKAEWAIGSQNVSYQVVSSFLYQFPFGHGKPYLNSAGRGTNLILGGWQIGGLENWSTGVPIVLGSVDNGTTPEAIFTQAQRPAWNGKSAKVSSPSRKLWFDPAVFSKPAPYTIGNAPRALADVHNPDNQAFDFSVIKNTQIGERYKVQFRMEMFNAFNHPTPGGPDTGVNNSTFGTISSGSFSNSARQIQLAAKLLF